jgi:drug/metabolite transporter (DMT)-like permease
MLALAIGLGIFFSALLTVGFKYFEKLNINTFHAILVNYITASSLSYLFADKSFVIDPTQGWFRISAGMGILFITTFIAMSVTAQQISVIICNIAAKMSLVIPLGFAFIFIGERITFLKIAAIVMAMAGVVLTVWKKENKVQKKSPSIKTNAGETNTGKVNSINGIERYFIIAWVFLGSGLIDASFKYVEHNYYDAVSPQYLMIVSYGSAGIAGLLWFLGTYARKRSPVHLKNIIAGILLGTVNYFSFYYVLVALHNGAMPSSVVFPVVNVGILITAAFLAMIFLKEKLKPINLIGALISVGSIFVLILQHYIGK